MGTLSEKLPHYLEALMALGIDAETIVFPSSSACGEPSPMPLQAALPGLTDAEWEILQAHLPPEPAQAEAMSNRELIEAVLWALAQRKAWTQIPGDRGEAVRKKFARWAHAGFWQGLYESARGQGLSPAREAQLAGIARRAAALKARMTGRHGAD